ncbi:MAG TPA: PSD1 and planctomycete cytochrome C domain-containing protein [Verrucomicrobiales bacterium]|nr:PSD1 and planctomycete cytochrome C domain-containing protein [Verrucomicrobiales bacterium]
MAISREFLLRTVSAALAMPAMWGVLRPPAAMGSGIDFNREISPILSNNCFQCHGPDSAERKADLRLDTFAGATADLGGYAGVVPGDPGASEVIRRITSTDPGEVMPPPESKKARLSAGQTAVLRRWIEGGAPYAGHWAFAPLSRVEPPPSEAPWARNGIDLFILSQLQEKRVQPSPEADRETLLRRLCLDLTGLPPGPEQRERFLSDERPDAWERLVEELLRSPHYGERWGRHWLDQARYADSDGYAIDGERQMWPYRDWVIRALNEDMPFDRFTIEQLAGDLLPRPTRGQLAATAFHRNTLINEEGGTDPEQFRVEAVVDRTNTTGAVWLGLTLGCAQCHTHKFDPITQREYYEFFAFFNNSTDRNNRGATLSVRKGDLLGAARDEPAVEPEDPGRPGRKPNPLRGSVPLMVMQETEKPRETFLLTRGDFTRPDHELGPLRPGVPLAIPPALPQSETPATRLDLARWLVDPENPLTPRVTVNRVWMRFFGRGLVETEEDLGTQSSYPSHPEMLDWLSRQFIAGGWSLKSLHRLIVNSATYRQSSLARPDLNEIDPRNVLLTRQARLRIEGEIARDAALLSSGLLTPQIGGPSVRPPQPDGVYAFTQRAKNWNADSGPDRYRRGLYTFFYRSAPYPLFTTFDAPDFQTVCTRRARSNTPLQALTMANDPAFLECAQALAARMAESSAALPEQVRVGFIATQGRAPASREAELLIRYAEEQSEGFRLEPEAGMALLDENLQAMDLPPERVAALVCVARALFNTDNFITRE